ncbi:MAG: hypothetical protein IK095_05200 [Oscillospiraceae bacterium]|nr:hypothetical protein [Oscillospiraceae bacterium]
MALCDGCRQLRIERPANMYDNWRAHCTDPDKPARLGKDRVVDTAPASWERGPVRIQRPVWCRKEST